jgi:HEAT repeat protein
MLAESIKAPSSLSTKEREDKAYQLAVLIRRKTGRAAPQKLVTDLAALMSDPDQMVRLWTAGALGNLGPQAAAAIPALEKAFEDAQVADPPGGLRTGIHLDDVIQQAMEKIRRRKK